MLEASKSSLVALEAHQLLLLHDVVELLLAADSKGVHGTVLGGVGGQGEEAWERATWQVSEEAEQRIEQLAHAAAMQLVGANDVRKLGQLLWVVVAFTLLPLLDGEGECVASCPYRNRERSVSLYVGDKNRWGRERSASLHVGKSPCDAAPSSLGSLCSSSSGSPQHSSSNAASTSCCSCCSQCC